MPVSAAAAYQFEISPLFSLMPRLSFGIAWMGTEIVKPDMYTKFSGSISQSVEPLLGVGLSAQFQVVEMFSAGLDANYGMIIERNPKHFFTIMANFTLRFKI